MGRYADYSVSLYYAYTLERIGHLVDLCVELAIGDIPVIADWLAYEVVGNLVLLGALGHVCPRRCRLH